MSLSYLRALDLNKTKLQNIFTNKMLYVLRRMLDFNCLEKALQAAAKRRAGTHESDENEVAVVNHKVNGRVDCTIILFMNP